MFIYSTSNDRNFLSSEWIFTKKEKKASTLQLKKDISIDSLFLQTWQKNDANMLTGSSSVAEDPKKRCDKNHNNAELHAAEVKGQCCDIL